MGKLDAHGIKNEWIRIPALAVVTSVQSFLMVMMASGFKMKGIVDTSSFDKALMAGMSGGFSVAYNGVVKLQAYLGGTPSPPEPPAG